MALVGAGCSANKTSVGDSAKSKEPIKLGWLGPLTGDVSSVGQADKDSVSLAVKEINKAGGINGRMLEMVYEDGACESKIASDAGQKLINIEKVLAIIGGACTGETMAVAPVAEQNKVLMISYASTAPTVTKAGDYIFRVIASDDYQGSYAAEIVYNKLSKKKAALLYGMTDYHKGLANAFTKRFKELGGEIAVSETYLQDDRDFKTQLTKIKNSGVDVLYFAAYTEAGIVGLKQMKELGLGMQIVGAETFDDPKFKNTPGVEGAIYTVPSSPENETFKTKYLAETGRSDMPVYVTQSYDAIMLLADVMKKAGVNPEDIKNELYKVKNYHGVSGAIGFDENGDITSAKYEVKVFKNGAQVKYDLYPTSD